jgi:hypothetical protein
MSIKDLANNLKKSIKLKTLLFLMLFAFIINKSYSQDFKPQSYYQKGYTSYIDFDTINYSMSPDNFYNL